MTTTSSSLMSTRETQAAFRSAWQQFLLTPTGSTRGQLENLMESLRGTGDEWEGFLNSLPGYRSFWKKDPFQAEETKEAAK